MNFRLDEETRKEIRIWCIEHNTTLADHLRRMIDDTLTGKIYTDPERKRKAEKKESELQDFLNEWN